MKHLFRLLISAFLVLGVQAAVEPATPEEKLKLAAEVHRIFDVKCASCHGAQLAKPKGKFGYVLDLKKVAANEDYIIAGDLKHSELYQMVVKNEMPGEDSDIPPLTPDELKIVARWVMVGAPGELPASLEPPKPLAPPVEPSFITRAFRWFGNFHPPSTHFPIALLLTAVLAEAFAWWLRKPEWTLLVRFLVVLGALTSIPTAILGWIAHYPTLVGSPLETVYNLHRILGTATAVWGVVCAVLICMAECPEGSFERKRFRGALLLGAVLVSVTGLLGGMLTFGIDHYKF